MEKPTYNFKTIHGDTTSSKKIKIDEADSSWKLEFKIYSLTGALTEEWTVENGRLERLDANTWKIKPTKESKKPNTYNYTLCYIVGNEEKFLLKGKITVSKHS